MSLRWPAFFSLEKLRLSVASLGSLTEVAWRQSRRDRLSGHIAELQQKLTEAVVLQEFSRALTPLLDRSQLLPPLTQAAQRLCQTQGLAVGWLTPERQEIELWTQTDPTLHNQRLPLEDAFLRDIIRVGWPVYIPDLSVPPLPAHLLQTLKGLGYGSLSIVPLRATHRVIGVLLAGWHTRRANISPREEELLQTLADQTIQALEHLRLYAEQERYLREAEVLRRVGQSISATLNLQEVLRLVAEEGARLLGCEAGALTLCTPDNVVEVAGASGVFARWRGLRLPLAESLTGVVVQERRSIRQTEVREQDLLFSQRLRDASEPVPRSLLAVPLWQEERAMGALIVSTSASRVFSLADERALQALADQAVHAITNARLYAQLQDALQREQAASRQKSTFFASASHELRTPLNIIAGYLDLVREGDIGQIDRAAAEALERAHKEVRHLVALIADLLDLSRLERAEFQLSWELVNLEDLLNETCAQWGKAIKDKGLGFRRVGDQPLPTITTDKARLRQILDNLIGNALKFTTVGHITAGARAFEDTVEVWVQDTGSGIDPADQERIFDEFQQIEQTPDPRFGGVGLGLAVCKKLVTLMKGEITVESLPAQGSKFTVRLPRQGNERQDSAATKGRSAA